MRLNRDGQLGIQETNPAVELDVAGRVAIGNLTELTIASGEMTITQSYHKVKGEGGAADNLIKIHGGVAGTIVVLSATDDSNDITIEHQGTGGNIDCGANVVLQHSSDTITLIYNGSRWMKVSHCQNV